MREWVSRAVCSLFLASHKAFQEDGWFLPHSGGQNYLRTFLLISGPSSPCEGYKYSLPLPTHIFSAALLL